MATIRDVRRAAAKLGGTVEGGHRRPSPERSIFAPWDYTVDAPPHHVWIGLGVHAFVTEWYHADESAEAIADMLETIRAGVEPCPPDCECRDE